MRHLLALAVLASSTPAFAGGIGLLAAGGVHGEQVYFYDQAAENRQYLQPQIIGSGGAGFELVLGDRDDRFLGFFRGYWLVDAPQHDPAKSTSLVDADNVLANWRSEPRHMGLGAVGLQIGFLGSPDTAQATVVAMVGSGFLTTDHEEFLFAEVGGGGAVALSRQVQLHGNLAYQLRHRKGFRHGGSLTIGARYMFD